MPAMIEFTIDSSQVEAYLEKKGELIIAALRGELTEQTVNLLSYIKDEKLSGQVLNSRTDNLRRSGFNTFEETVDTLLGTVNFGSGPTTRKNVVPYAAIQNYGGAINVPEVTGKLMVFERGGETVFTRRHRAFTVQMPARNYMESSLEEKSPEILAGLQAAVDEVAKE